LRIYERERERERERETERERERITTTNRGGQASGGWENIGRSTWLTYIGSNEGRGRGILSFSLPLRRWPFGIPALQRRSFIRFSLGLLPPSLRREWSGGKLGVSR